MAGLTGFLVDIEQLQCGGCGGPVSPERPAGEGDDGPDQDFSHRDGSPLCAEPVEAA